jgi:hypothetical protein
MFSSRKINVGRKEMKNRSPSDGHERSVANALVLIRKSVSPVKQTSQPAQKTLKHSATLVHT